MCEFSAKVILADIEGTTTSISFVKDVLFPYAKQHTKEYLQETWQNQETVDIVRDLINLPQFEDFRKENAARERMPEDLHDVATMEAFVRYLIDKDVKVGPLKKLQGLVWEKGYQNGSLKGHVYPDVPAAFKRWQEEGIRLAIYSSGSIKAQQLLFGQTEVGNLLTFISGHFDTTSGHKQEVQSYTNIAKSLEIEPEDIIFLTDVIKEAEAARAAGFQTVILSRPGNAPLTDDDKSQFTFVYDFDCLIIKNK